MTQWVRGASVEWAAASCTAAAVRYREYACGREWCERVNRMQWIQRAKVARTGSASTVVGKDRKRPFWWVIERERRASIVRNGGSPTFTLTRQSPALLHFNHDLFGPSRYPLAQLLSDLRHGHSYICRSGRQWHKGSLHLRLRNFDEQILREVDDLLGTLVSYVAHRLPRIQSCLHQ